MIATHELLTHRRTPTRMPIHRSIAVKIGVIGAGPSGLCLGMFLEHDTDVLEARSDPGGTAGSFEVGGYTFDHGPHIMFSRNQEILDFMVSSLGENVHRCRRNNRIAYAGRLVKYPFENDLAALGQQEAYECARDYFVNPWRERYPRPADLREWFLHHFGEAMCEKYFFPYNEKVWNVPVADLSMSWAERIPQPPAADVLKSAMGIATEGYVHQLYYHYPLHGGYQAISRAWADRVQPHFGFEVRRISLPAQGGVLVSGAAEDRHYERVVSTMPLDRLVGLADFPIPDRVRAAVDALLVNPMIVVSLGIAGSDAEQMTAVYFPASDFKVNRLSFPATFSPHNAPAGCHSIQAEITCRAEDPTWAWSDREALEHVVGGLLDAGILSDPDAVVLSHVERVEHAYVVYRRGYDEHARVVREWFPQQGIDLCGRFGYFEYVNVDGAVARAMDVAGRLNGRAVRLDALPARV
jgi:protoporphyrinogen oxidase